MATETRPKPKEETPAKPADQDPLKVDPFVSSIIKSMENVITPEQILKKEPPPPAPTMSDGIPLSDRPVRPEKPKATDGEPKKDDAQAAEPKPTEAAKPAASEKPAETAKPQTVIRVMKRAPAPAAPTPPPPAPAPSPEKPKETVSDEDLEYIKSLTEEQQEQIAVAQFAESKGLKKGALKQTLDYCRAVDTFIDEHPGVSPDSEEFAAFVQENSPNWWEESEYRRIERKMIEEKAVETARKEVQASIEPMTRELREIRSKPVIERAIQNVDRSITQADPENKDFAVIPKQVVEALDQKGFEAAATEFPMETKFVQGARAAAGEWMAIRNGVRNVNLEDPTHSWLINMVGNETRNMLQLPPEEQVRDGKTFTPIDQMIRMQRENPAEAEKHWTFSDDEIVEMVTDAALLEYNAEIDRLRKSGWERKVLAKAENETPAKPAAAAPSGENNGSPRAGSRAMPGPTEPEPKTNPHAAFFDKILPGWEAILDGK